MILLIAETPVAGTVNRLAHWIGALTGTLCHSLILKNYPNNVFRIQGGSFGSLPHWEAYLANSVRKAELLIIHNVSDRYIMDIVFSLKHESTPIIYQYHSPPNEPPQYGYNVINMYFFDAIFAVAQGYGRFIKDAILVPNVIADIPTGPVPVRKSKTIFSPHLRSTIYRWSKKFSDQDQKMLQDLRNYFNGYKVQTIKGAFGTEAVTHEEILFFLRSVTLVIDDVNTGLFHQTALEGIKAGALVLSGADLVSIEEFCLAAQSPPPPFVNAHGIEEVIFYLLNLTRKRSLHQHIARSNSYAKEYLGEYRLAKRYMDILRPYIHSK